MLGLILSFVGGPVINGLISAYRERLAATNTQDHMALDLLQKEVDAEIAARSEATKLLIAEQGHWYTAMIRPLFAAPFIIYLWYIIVFNKVLGVGVVEHGIDANMWVVFQTIIVSYFGATAAERVAKIFKR
jgi:hypothetical protein